MIRYDTLLDAARQHFRAVANSPSYVRSAREVARQLEREVEAELVAYNAGEPMRELIELFRRRSGGAAWDGEPEALRAA